MHISRSALYILLLLPLFADAQGLPPLFDHPFYTKIHFAASQDSADFVQFRNGLQMADPTLSQDISIRYRMVWSEHQYGGIWTVNRGDRSLLNGSVRIKDAMSMQFRLPCLTAEGRRAMVLWQDVPCAIICRSMWYFVEE